MSQRLIKQVIDILRQDIKREALQSTIDAMRGANSKNQEVFYLDLIKKLEELAEKGKCPNCGGDGQEIDGMSIGCCRYCNGAGMLVGKQYVHDYNVLLETRKIMPPKMRGLSKTRHTIGEEKFCSPKKHIPAGFYCYSNKYVCPFWDSSKEQPEQLNGYCHLLDKGDWEFDGDIRSPTELWDQCKECGININEDSDGKDAS